MRFVLSLFAILLSTGLAPAQVINGQSTDDAAFAPRPPARWHSPESQGEVPGGKLDDDPRDVRPQDEKPRD